MKNIFTFVLGLFLLISAASAQDAQEKLRRLKTLTESSFSAASLENERDEQVNRTLNVGARDEFETPAMYEKRKATAGDRAEDVRADYNRRIAAARDAFDLRIADLKDQIASVIAGSAADVTSELAVGTYDAAAEEFPLTLLLSGGRTKIRIPLASARNFKTEAASLTAQGKKRLKENGDWEYLNWRVTTPDQQTIAFGPQIDASSKIPGVRRPSAPPSLAVSVEFIEPSGNNRLDAEEKGEISVKFLNSGKGSAMGLEILAAIEGASGVKIPQSVYVGEILPGASKTVSLPLAADGDVPDGKAMCTVSFKEAFGFAPAAKKISFETKALVPPQLTLIQDVGIDDASKNSKIEPGEIVAVTVRIQNTGSGEAKNVRAVIDVGNNVFVSGDSKSSFDAGTLASGAFKDLSFSIYTNLQANDVPVYVTATESRGKFGIKRSRLPLEFNKQIATIEEVTVKGKDESAKTVTLAAGLSIDIEKNIPESAKRNPNAVAVIMAISDYANANVPRVEYAKRDAQIMRDYLVKTLGYSAENILPKNPDEQMTAGNMKTLLRQMLKSYVKPDGNSDLFIYYTGHGAPNTTTNEAFFVPYDCNPSFVNTDNAYSVSEFYADVAKIKAKRKIIVIDACFSGQSGGGQALVKNASPALLKLKNAAFTDPNAVVFQSSEAEQVSNWYPTKKHGMFTYFFLKGLQGGADANGDGAVTVGELESYINNPGEGLPYVSNREFQRPQRAVITGAKEQVIATVKP